MAVFDASKGTRSDAGSAGSAGNWRLKRPHESRREKRRKIRKDLFRQANRPKSETEVE